jgi:hypothetical protein
MISLRTFIDDLRFHIDENSLSVRSEQLRARLKLYPYLLTGQMLVEPFFVWVLWNTHSHLDLLLWLGGANLMHLLQLAIWLNHRNDT